MLRNLASKFAVSLILILVSTATLAQEAKPQPPTSTYRLDYVFSEMQENKRINARSYTLLVRVMEKAMIKTGSRVPIFTGGSKEAGNQIQYLDVGMNIDCRIGRELDTGVDLMTSVETSNLVPEQPGENRTGDPVIRQVRYAVDNVVPVGKQTLLGSADEVDGTRRLQIEVTATKVR
jgi:hypothetical protein